MNPINILTEGYDRKARLYPALLLIAPVIATVAATMSVKLSALESLGVLIVGCGGSFFLTQIVRDAGKRKESILIKKWGGLPSMTIFRHRDNRLDPITKARYHEKLTALVKGSVAPTIDEEQSNPVVADQVYLAWSNYLRVNTRDTKKYSLLFQENVNYGYRRNVWGLRSKGIIICIFCCVITFVRIYFLYENTGEFNKELVTASVFVLALLAFWIFKFSTEWVSVPANAYALRLAETIETLAT